MKRAVVLGGGGARGPYQIGVWRALRELGVEYSIVTGTSVGALNGALMAQGEYALARKLWEELTVDDVIARPEALDENQPIPVAYLRQMVGHGGLDISPLESKVRAVIDEPRIRQSPIAYGLVAVQYPRMKPVQLCKEEIPEGQLADYLLASASWFPFFQRRTIDGVDYIDGAYADNLPADLAVRCGAEEIIAVDLQGAGIVHKFKTDIPVKHIRSHWGLGEMLDFSPDRSRLLMAIGYLDGLRAYRRVEGRSYAFLPGETRKNALRLRGVLNRIHRSTGVSLLGRRDALLRWQESFAYHSHDHRFVPPEIPRCTLGCALTTAAEIAGELFGLPPDRQYRLQGFHRLLLERVMRLEAGERLPRTDVLFPINRRAQALTLHLLRQLRKGFWHGGLSERLLGMAAVSPAEFSAAYYLLALELRHGQGMY